MASNLTELNNGFTELETMRKEISFEIAKNRPVKGIQGVTPQVDRRLRELGILTVEDLSKADLANLTGINGNTARALVRRAKERLELSRG